MLGCAQKRRTSFTQRKTGSLSKINEHSKRFRSLVVQKKDVPVLRKLKLEA